MSYFGYCSTCSMLGYLLLTSWDILLILSELSLQFIWCLWKTLLPSKIHCTVQVEAVWCCSSLCLHPELVCYSYWSAVLGRRRSKTQWGIPIPKMGCTIMRKIESPEAPRCNCMFINSFLLYFYFLGCGISEVSKEERRTFHHLSKLRNNRSHNKGGKNWWINRKNKVFLAEDMDKL